jgi:hypothetical protein
MVNIGLMVQVKTQKLLDNFWINMRTDITDYVKSCSLCQRTQRSKEELIVRSQPTNAFEEIGVDLFLFKPNQQILIVDAFSNFYNFKKLDETKLFGVIQLKCWFALFGIPSKLYSDNGLQFSSRYFRQFSNDWQFEHCTSGPFFPRSNGLAVRFVQEA